MEWGGVGWGEEALIRPRGLSTRLPQEPFFYFLPLLLHRHSLGRSQLASRTIDKQHLHGWAVVPVPVSVACPWVCSARGERKEKAFFGLGRNGDGERGGVRGEEEEEDESNSKRVEVPVPVLVLVPVPESIKFVLVVCAHANGSRRAYLTFLASMCFFSTPSFVLFRSVGDVVGVGDAHGTVETPTHVKLKGK